VAERPESGVLDTCVFIDLDLLDRSVIPVLSSITAITMAELHKGVAVAKDSASRVARTERLGTAIAAFEPLPFDGEAAARYGSLVALTLAANRDPRPRTLDLMIAAIASCHGLPLFTRNAKDFVGLGGLVEVVAV
jgi:predicted nucleic acid-binding protein